MSYAPFRGGQNPLEPGLVIGPEQMAEDLAQLAKVTGCIRTYSVGNGLERIPELAEKAGLTVGSILVEAKGISVRGMSATAVAEHLRVGTGTRDLVFSSDPRVYAALRRALYLPLSEICLLPCTR